MANDPRKYIMSDCRRGQQTQINQTSDARSFFDGLGKLGDLEVLNDIGASNIGTGLRVLDSISDTIGIGSSSIVTGANGEAISIPGFLAQSAEQGTDFVLETVGVNTGAISTLNSLNPGAANSAYGQARQIFERVKQGNFDIRDFPGFIGDIKNLTTLIGGIFTPRKEPKSKNVCFASPYAAALAYNYSPKFKFMFIVQFVLNSDFQAVFGESARFTAFLVKTSQRPTIQFEYEDVNMYNFRTKVLKQTTYQPIQMSFYDDQKNNALAFYERYLKLISPIANMEGTATSFYESSGMAFNEQESLVSNQDGTLSSRGINDGGNLNFLSASTRALPGASQHKTIFDKVVLYHIMNFGRHMTAYEFYNPRIIEMSFDDLDMAESSPSELQLQFAYDGLFIQPSISLSEEAERVQDLTSFNQYPISYNASEQLSGSDSDTLSSDYGLDFSNTSFDTFNSSTIHPDVLQDIQFELDDQSINALGGGVLGGGG